jgi:hypothetical protein
LFGPSCIIYCTTTIFLAHFLWCGLMKCSYGFLISIPPEISGTGGAFASSAAISRFGNNYSFFLTPVFFTFAGVCLLSYFIACHSHPLQITWALVSNLNHQKAEPLAKLESSQRRGPLEYLVQVVRGAIHFGHSVSLGAKLVLLNRRFICAFCASTGLLVSDFQWLIVYAVRRAVSWLVCSWL